MEDTARKRYRYKEYNGSLVKSDVLDPTTATRTRKLTGIKSYVARQRAHDVVIRQRSTLAAECTELHLD